MLQALKRFEPDKLFFNLRRAKSKISALEDGDLRPDQVKLTGRLSVCAMVRSTKANSLNFRQAPSVKDHCRNDR